MNCKSPGGPGGVILALLSAIVWACDVVGAAEAERVPPNFVLTFNHAMGCGDIGPFGSELNDTPHLDRMGKKECG